MKKLLAMLGLLLLSSAAFARCDGVEMIDPTEDIVWDCMFPWSIMGTEFDYGEHPPDDKESESTCECEGEGYVGEGFVMTFWEPARLMDTVKDAWCFPGIGMDFSSDMESEETEGGGSNAYDGRGELFRHNAKVAFQHFHFYIMPFWAVLGMFADSQCKDSETFDIAMVSEVRPDWGDDLAAAEYYPETSLMANPFTVFACVADAVAAVAQKTIDALYWCMGAWGLTYPMTGIITTSDYVEANAGIAAKAMYVQGRTGMLHDRATNLCFPVNPPIWTKSHWRLQMAKPQADSRCHLIGHQGLLWTYRKNTMGVAMDNFSWVIFRKVRCCVVVI
jgi:conjugal transfer pilus assembly protein TraU